MPAHKFEANAALPPVGDHEYVNAPNPPIALTEAVPSHKAPQTKFVFVTVNVMAGG